MLKILTHTIMILLLTLSQAVLAQPIGEWFQNDHSDKAVILIGGAEGGLGWAGLIQQIDQLKLSGYSIFQTAYFNYPNTAALLEEIELEYFKQVVDWVAEKKLTIIIIAHSRGTEAAQLISNNNNKVDKLVLISPASHVFQGIKLTVEATLNDRRSAWKENGKALGFINFDISPEQIKLTEEAAKNSQMCQCIFDIYQQSLAKANQSTRIAINKMSSDILLVSSDSDPIWPAQLMATMIEKTMIENAGIVTHWREDGGHMPHTQAEVWQRIIQFTKK